MSRGSESSGGGRPLLRFRHLWCLLGVLTFYVLLVGGALYVWCFQ